MADGTAMSLTPHQARYYALDLVRRAHARDVSSVGAALFDAQVDLNPHQIEAALFGIRATAESGRLLADEVGLGKTIEAALVLSQLWAERRRRLLVVAPASLRRQWVDELQKKFGLPTRLVDAKGGKAGKDGLGAMNPFEQPAVVVCSYQFAAKQAARVAAVGWDLVIIDEAHRLRNAWRASSGTGQALVSALGGVPKLMLTATPLQNSLIELFGLVTLLDPNALGDESTFRARFLKGKTDYAELKQRLATVCHRTLRREVLPYIRYTQRRPMTWRFSPSQAERDLYRAVSDLLARDTLHGLPNAQRALITMVLRKLLASSSAAIGGALTTLRANLAAKRDALLAAQGATETPSLDPAAFEDEGLDDEWLDELEPLSPPPEMGSQGGPPVARGDAAGTDTWTMDDELAALDELIALAASIATDKRALALVDALEVALAQTKSLGAAEKAVIFTESRRTQASLARLLEAHYPGQIVCFNGTNDDPGSAAILDAWAKKNPQAMKDGSRAANMRQALVEHFRDHATLFIATEAGAEGLNLQFCSLVVNYDLPWNPQRLEQRIGRCHRYGQRHDVVVVNFLDKDNLADKRVLELLEDKIGLFSGVFGASDAVLGAVESGVGLERKITRIFQTCRTPDAIEAAFAELRREMDEVIRDKESKAKKALFEHFDDTVHDRLKIQLDLARARLDRMGRQFWALSRWALGDDAHFSEAAYTFELASSPAGLSAVEAPPGRYELVTRGPRGDHDAFVYRMTHPLGEHVLERGRSVPVPLAELVFDVSHHPVKVSAARELIGKRGWLGLERLTVEGLSAEEHLSLAGFVDGGPDLDPETLDRLLSVSARVEEVEPSGAETAMERVRAGLSRLRSATLAAAAERNSAEFDEARARLERWADDQIKAAEVAIVEVRELLRALEKEARLAQTLDEKRAIEQKIGRAEEQRRKARAWVFKVEDEVAGKRKALLDELERRMAQRSQAETVFVVAWRVI